MLQKEEQNDAPTLSIRSAMGMKKRSLSWSGAANHAIKATNAQQLGV
jgi:hypothetical protein